MGIDLLKHSKLRSWDYFRFLSSPSCHRSRILLIILPNRPIPTQYNFRLLNIDGINFCHGEIFSHDLDNFDLVLAHCQRRDPSKYDLENVIRIILICVLPHLTINDVHFMVIEGQSHPIKIDLKSHLEFVSNHE